MRARRVAIALAAAGLMSSLVTAGAQARPSCAADTHAGGEWRFFGQTLTGERSQPDEHLIDSVRAATLQPAWTFNANQAAGSSNNEITGYPVVADGCVYVGSSTGTDAPGSVFAINAETGALVWRTPLPHGVYSTLAVDEGKVYAFMSHVGGPTLIAFDQATGDILWQTQVDDQPGSDAVSSPVPFDGMVWVGVSGTVAEGNEGDRANFHGNFVLVDEDTGDIIKKTYTIPEDQWEGGYAGGSMWGTISIDPETKYGYQGTGNPFNLEAEHPRTNSVVKIDLDRSRETFGQIVGHYKGNIEQYYGELRPTCATAEIFLGGFECGNLDLDFGSAPNIFTDSEGRRLVGAGQKSGVYHVFDADTMEPVYTTLMGVPSLVGGIVGSAAYDGSSLFVPHSPVGYLASLEKDTGAFNWVSPTADAVHWGNPVAVANGVVYTVDLKGFIDAYDAATGLPLLHRPMSLGSGTGLDPTLSWGAATVARNTVFASVGVGLSSANIGTPDMPNGFVIAYRPAL